MIFGFLFFLLLSGLAWVLWAPFRLEIDSLRNVYSLAWVPLAEVKWLPEKGLDVVETRLFFFHREIELSRPGNRRSKPAQTQKTKAKPRQKRKKNTRFSFRQVRTLAFSLLKTFRIRRCQVWWDCDDFPLNAWLFPAGYFLKSETVQVSINFQGRRDLVLLVENRLGRMLWAILKSFIFNKQP